MLFIDTQGQDYITHPCVFLTISHQIITNLSVKHTSVFAFIYSGVVTFLNDNVGFASVSGGFPGAFVLITYYWVNFVEAWVDRTSLCVDTSGEDARMRAACESFFFLAPIFSYLSFYSLLVSCRVFSCLLFSFLLFSSLLFSSFLFPSLLSVIFFRLVHAPHYSLRSYAPCTFREIWHHVPHHVL